MRRDWGCRLSLVARDVRESRFTELGSFKNGLVLILGEAKVLPRRVEAKGEMGWMRRN